MGAVSLFASELRGAREAAGMSQEQLAQAMNFSQSLVAQVEGGRKGPSAEFTSKADEILQTGGLLERIRRHNLTQAATPEWLRSWYDTEQEAIRIWWFELSLIPGLLQVEEYARAVLRGDEAKVAARLERQEVLTRETPPAYVAVIDERALRYDVGGTPVMRQQLEHLAAMAERLVIQVVPAGCGTYLHLDGSFGIATVDGREYVYCDTPARGWLLSEPEIVSDMKERWDFIRAEALSRRQTIQLIREVAEQWT